MKDQRSFRSTYVNAVVSTLQSQYLAPKFKVDLPLIHRSNEGDLKKVIGSSGLFLLVGPSNSGKSSYFQQLVNGRSATVYLSGKKIGTTKQELLEGIADAFGCGYVEATSRKGNVQFRVFFFLFALIPVADLTLQGLLGMIEEALQVGSVMKLSPLFILDDVQKFCEDSVVKPDAVDFLTWCQEITNLSLMNFVMISSDRQAIEPLQKCALILASCVDISFLTLFWRSVGVLCALGNSGDALRELKHPQVVAAGNSYRGANLRSSAIRYACNFE